MVSPSLLFRGRRAANNLQLDSFAYLLDMKPQSESRLFWLAKISGSFCLGVWFALLPASNDCCFGGAIYGMQSALRDSRPWPHYHLPIVIVNAVGDLYCSILDSKPVVATNLQSDRWYHLMLSYDCNLQRQDVVSLGEKTSSRIEDTWDGTDSMAYWTSSVSGDRRWMQQMQRSWQWVEIFQENNFKQL
ncbi:hypothetical protein V7S43_009886 [Phytophthora oleae]|uniref:Uncharacterized protein n=1 Tax=Phytophthora oleae TaxID=2107226 RepID=A0ABD3FEQ6_9STRA